MVNCMSGLILCSATSLPYKRTISAEGIFRLSMNFIGLSPKMLGSGVGSPLGTLKLYCHKNSLGHYCLSGLDCDLSVSQYHKIHGVKLFSLNYHIHPVVWYKRDTPSIINHGHLQFVPFFVCFDTIS